MPGQVIGTVNVQIGQTTNPKVNNITYGNRSLKSANDVDLNGIQENGAIIYQANTNSFVVAPVTAAVIGDVDGGLF